MYVLRVVSLHVSVETCNFIQMQVGYVCVELYLIMLTDELELCTRPQLWDLIQFLLPDLSYCYLFQFTAAAADVIDLPKPDGDATFTLRTGQPAFSSYISVDQSKPSATKLDNFNE